MTHSVTLPGRTLAIVCVYNNLDPDQSGFITSPADIEVHRTKLNYKMEI